MHDPLDEPCVPCASAQREYGEKWCPFHREIVEAWEESERYLAYRPPPRIKAIARRHADEDPSMEWLCWLPRDERRWYLGDEYRLQLFVSIHPTVTEAEWLTLLS